MVKFQSGVRRQMGDSDGYEVEILVDSVSMPLTTAPAALPRIETFEILHDARDR